MSDLNLIKKQQQFHLKWVKGFWGPCTIDHPFGVQMINFPGNPSFLWTYYNHENWSAEEIIYAVENAAKKWFGNPGFQFSETWKDTDSLKELLLAKGYECKTILDWHFHDLKDLKKFHCDFEIKPIKEINDFLAFDYKVFGTNEVGLQRLKYQFERPMGLIKDKFLGAFDKGKLIGCILYAYDEEIGYYHTLGVDGYYRRKSISKALVCYALKEMKSNKVDFVFTAT